MSIPENGEEPADVAAAIEHAVTDPRPRLRYLVGTGAQDVLAARSAMSDEEYIDLLGRRKTDEEFTEALMQMSAPPSVTGSLSS